MSSKQYMADLKTREKNANNLSYVTANRDSYYNNNSYENNIGCGRTNMPSDYSKTSSNSSSASSSSYSGYNHVGKKK